MPIDTMKVAGSALDAAINTAAILADKQYGLSKPFERAKDWAALGVTIAGGAISYMEDRPSTMARVGEGMLLGGIPLLGESILHLADNTITAAFPGFGRRGTFTMRGRGQPSTAGGNRNVLYSRPGAVADVAVLTG